MNMASSPGSSSAPSRVVVRQDCRRFRIWPPHRYHRRIVGAVIGGYLAGALGIAVGGGLISSIIVAVIGAVILLFVLRLFKRG